MDAYFVVGIDAEKCIARIQHCSSGAERDVSFDTAIDAARVQKLKGVIQGIVIPCISFGGYFVQDYYLCGTLLFHLVDWQYHRVFPRQETERFSVFTVNGYLVVAGKHNYLWQKLRSIAFGYTVWAVEVYSRDKYDLITVQSVKAGAFSSLPMVCTEVYKVSSRGLRLLCCSDLAKFNRIDSKLVKLLKAGKTVRMDSLVGGLQKLSITDDGTSLFLEGNKLV